MNNPTQSSHVETFPRGPPSLAEGRASHQLLGILRSVPEGDITPQSSDVREFLGNLEYYISELLQLCVGWPSHETLDGILPTMVEKLSADRIKVVGTCILISDQTVTPMKIELRSQPDGAQHREFRFQSVRCYVGEMDEATGEFLRFPYGSQKASVLSSALHTHPETFSWLFKIEVGVDIRASTLSREFDEPEID